MQAITVVSAAVGYATGLSLLLRTQFAFHVRRGCHSTRAREKRHYFLTERFEKRWEGLISLLAKNGQEVRRTSSCRGRQKIH